MIRKVKKSDLARFQEQTGVRVRYVDDAKNPKSAAQEVVLRIPEGLLEPLINTITKAIEAHERTQEIMASALAHMTADLPVNIEVTERDDHGN